jgi:hypothetical protein
VGIVLSSIFKFDKECFFMADSTAKKGADKAAAAAAAAVEAAVAVKEIIFKCKFCGESKPLSELVVIRTFYPQLSACKVCARGVVEYQQPE